MQYQPAARSARVLNNFQLSSRIYIEQLDAPSAWVLEFELYMPLENIIR